MIRKADTPDLGAHVRIDEPVRPPEDQVDDEPAVVGRPIVEWHVHMGVGIAAVEASDVPCTRSCGCDTAVAPGLALGGLMILIGLIARER